MPLQPEFGGEQVVMGLQQALNRARMAGSKATASTDPQVATLKAISAIQKDVRRAATSVRQPSTLRAPRVLPPRDARGRFTRRVPDLEARGGFLDRLSSLLPNRTRPVSLSPFAIPNDPVGVQVFLLRRAITQYQSWNRNFLSNEQRWDRRQARLQLLERFRRRPTDSDSGLSGVLGNLFSTFGKWGTALLGLPAMLSGIFSRSGSFFSNLWSGLRTRMGSLGETLAAKMRGILAPVGSAARRGAGRVGAAVGSLASRARGVGAAVRANPLAVKAIGVAEAAGSKIGSLASEFSGTLGKTGTKVLEAGLAIAAISGKVMGVAGKVLGFGVKMLPFLGLGLDSFFDYKSAKAGGKTGLGLIFGTLFGDTGKGSKASAMEILGHVGGQSLKWGGLGFVLGGPIGAAVGAVLGGGIALIKDGFETGFIQTTFKKMKAVFGPVGKIFVALFKGLWRNVTNAWSSATRFLATTAGTLWDRVKSSISGAIAGSVDSIKKKWEGFGTTVSGLMQDIRAGVSTRVTEFIQSVTGAIQNTRALAGSLGTKMMEVLGRVGEKFWDVIHAVEAALKGFSITSVFKKAGDAVSFLVGEVKTFLGGIFKEDGLIMSAIKTSFQKAFDVFGGLWDFVSAAGAKVTGAVAKIFSGNRPAQAIASVPAQPTTALPAPNLTAQQIRALEIQRDILREQNLSELAPALRSLIEALSRQTGSAAQESMKVVKDLLSTMTAPVSAHSAAPSR